MNEIFIVNEIDPQFRSHQIYSKSQVTNNE